MDANAKCWWDTLSHNKHCPVPVIIPGEGWSIFLHKQKLATFNRTIFDFHTQYQYSRWYWEQPGKLGTIYNSIDWSVCSEARKNFPLAQQLWSTKWLTNWLPTGKNMLRGNQWISNQCPSCRMAIEDTNHIVSCLVPDGTKHLSMQLMKLEGTLISKQIPPPAATMMLQVFFPQWYPQQAGIQPMDILICSQLKIVEIK